MKLLSSKEIEAELIDLSEWNFIDKYLVKDFVFKDFVETIKIMNKIAVIAENMNHHPDWSNVYNRLTIKLSTHDEDGVTLKDIELAKAIETIIALERLN